MALEIEPADAESLLTSASLIDVREPWEYQRERLKGAYHIPLGQIPRRVDEIRALVSERPSAIVYCQHGIRSLKAVEFLHQAGIEKPRSLRGGMAEWCARGGVNVLRGPEAGEAGRDH